MYEVDSQDKRLIPLRETTLTELGLQERYDLQEWIENAPDLLGEKLLIVAKELELSWGARLDLLALDTSGNLVVIELKRDESGRYVDWQAIRYASYVSNFTSEDLVERFAAYKGIDASEAEQRLGDFAGVGLESLNSAQRIILCARDFHSDVASAVFWLRDLGIDIACIRIQSYADATGRLFINPDPIIPLPEARDYITRKERKERERKAYAPWSGYYFLNVGEGDYRSWEDNVRYGFVSAGGGAWYSEPLYRLKEGDTVFAYIKRVGYVGYGEVEQAACPISEFTVNGNGRRLLDVDLKAKAVAHDIDNPELCEHAIGIRWIKTFPREQAKTFTGVFANQNIVCKLTHKETVEFVEREFGLNLE